MKTCVYVRCSTQNQIHSLETQELAINNFLKSKGIDNYKLFSDFGISGSKDSRESLNEMMSKIRNGEFQCLAVYSFSRFSRNLKTLISALEEFNKLSVSFISVSESLDTSNIVGKLIFNIISSLSQFEREQTAIRVRAGLDRAKAAGKKLGRAKSRNSILIQDLHGQGLSYRKIASIAKCSLGTVSKEISSIKNEIMNNKNQTTPYT